MMSQCLRGLALRGLKALLAPLDLVVCTRAEDDNHDLLHAVRRELRALREEHEKLVRDASKQREDDHARIELRDLQLAAAEERTAVLRRVDALCAQMPDTPLVLAARRELDEALGRVPAGRE